MKIYLLSANKNASSIEKIQSTLKKSKNKTDISIVESENLEDYASKNMDQILNYDVVLIEASTRNSQLGYEAAFALENNIPVVVLYHDETGNKDLFPLIALNPKTKLIIKAYKMQNIESEVETAISEIEDFNNNKLTLSFNKQTSGFLNWISDNKKIAKSDYIRSLVDAAMKKNTAYRNFLKKK
jgi:hypothetical protein